MHGGNYPENVIEEQTAKEDTTSFVTVSQSER